MRNQEEAVQGPAQFRSVVILRAVRRCLQFPISYRDLELTLRDRSVSVDHTTVYWWIQKLCGTGGEGMGPSSLSEPIPRRWPT
jgi:transposase-like protein